MGYAGIDPVIIRTRRKTIALILMPDGRLVVRAPLHTTQHQIDEMIDQKAGWIREKQKVALERQTQHPHHRFAEGETFLYLGESYPLQRTDRARPLLALENGQFLLSRSVQKDKVDIFIAWYREQARRVFDERIACYENLTGLRHKLLKISSARSRWGSCSSIGTLSFPWRLVMAPLPVIDYVVVHELAHLVEPNHSTRFWQKVENILPDYRQRLAWLKNNGHLLNLS